MNYTGNGWDEILSGEFNAPYFKALMEKVNAEYATKTVYPPKDEIFAAMKTVDYDKVKVVIIGQDPYHGAGQANGMAFSVNKGVPLPPSLQNIFKEIKDEYGASPDGGTLVGWAKQGVLLLNTVLTVREASPQSHSAYGWQQFTDSVIEACSKRDKPMVFLLWGSNAIAKKKSFPLRTLFWKARTPVLFPPTADFSAAVISVKPTNFSLQTDSSPSTGLKPTTPTIAITEAARLREFSVLFCVNRLAIARSI